jgi:hypothetical protein
VNLVSDHYAISTTYRSHTPIRRPRSRELNLVSTVLTETSNKKYLWDGVEIAEERDVTGGILPKQFFSQGFWKLDTTKHPPRIS